MYMWMRVQHMFLHLTNMHNGEEKLLFHLCGSVQNKQFCVTVLLSEFPQKDLDWKNKSVYGFL